jgi:hypothetical protein
VRDTGIQPYSRGLEQGSMGTEIFSWRGMVVEGSSASVFPVWSLHVQFNNFNLNEGKFKSVTFLPC